MAHDGQKKLCNVRLESAEAAAATEHRLISNAASLVLELTYIP